LKRCGDFRDAQQSRFLFRADENRRPAWQGEAVPDQSFFETPRHATLSGMVTDIEASSQSPCSFEIPTTRNESIDGPESKSKFGAPCVTELHP